MYSTYPGSYLDTGQRKGEKAQADGRRQKSGETRVLCLEQAKEKEKKRKPKEKWTAGEKPMFLPFFPPHDL